MNPLPATNQRTNYGTWAVPRCLLPAHRQLHARRPAQRREYDPNFLGQLLETTYFDTRSFDLRKARLARAAYVTLRIRCYQTPGGDVYALAQDRVRQVSRRASRGCRRRVLPGEQRLGRLAASGNLDEARGAGGSGRAGAGGECLLSPLRRRGRRRPLHARHRRPHRRRQAPAVRRAGVQGRRRARAPPSCQSAWIGAASHQAEQVPVVDRLEVSPCPPPKPSIPGPATGRSTGRTRAGCQGRSWPGRRLVLADNAALGPVRQALQQGDGADRLRHAALDPADRRPARRPTSWPWPASTSRPASPAGRRPAWPTTTPARPTSNDLVVNLFYR